MCDCDAESGDDFKMGTLQGYQDIKFEISSIAAMKLMLVLEKRDGRETTTPNENEWSGR